MLQVEWDPYDRRDIRELNMAPYVEAEKVLWRSNVAMIFYYVVEHHLPQRVMKQFGRNQNFLYSTSRQPICCMSKLDFACIMTHHCMHRTRPQNVTCVVLAGFQGGKGSAATTGL